MPADSPPKLPTSSSTSANKFANGRDQNSGNVMTGFPTTRVSAPPGGKSQIVFDDSSGERQNKLNSQIQGSTNGNPTSTTASSIHDKILQMEGISEPLKRGQTPEWGRQSYTLGNNHSSLGLGLLPSSPDVNHKKDLLSKNPPPSVDTEKHRAGEGRRYPEVRKLGFPPPSEILDETTGEVIGYNNNITSSKQHNIFNRKSLADDPRFVKVRDVPHSELMEGRVPPGGRSTLRWEENVLNGGSSSSGPGSQLAAGGLSSRLNSKHSGSSGSGFSGSNDNGRKESVASLLGQETNHSHQIPAGVRPAMWSEQQKATTRERTPPRENSSSQQGRAPPGGKSTICLG